jgi:hypothetical protein
MYYTEETNAAVINIVTHSYTFGYLVLTRKNQAGSNTTSSPFDFLLVNKSFTGPSQFQFSSNLPGKVNTSLNAHNLISFSSKDPGLLDLVFYLLASQILKPLCLLLLKQNKPPKSQHLI